MFSLITREEHLIFFFLLLFVLRILLSIDGVKKHIGWLVWVRAMQRRGLDRFAAPKGAVARQRITLFYFNGFKPFFKFYSAMELYLTALFLLTLNVGRCAYTE